MYIDPQPLWHVGIRMHATCVHANWETPFNPRCMPRAWGGAGYTKEEMKVSWEMRKIFEMRDNVKISCTAVRTPTLRAHSESIVLETVKPIAAADVRALLASAPGTTTSFVAPATFTVSTFIVSSACFFKCQLCYCQFVY